MNSACCSIPPVVATDYTPKGTYEEIVGIKSYTVGPKDAKHVIVAVYDIFGFASQTQQGADLLATLGFRVIMPDLFRGKPFPVERMTPTGSEAEQKALMADIGNFIGTTGNFQERIPELQALSSALRSAGAEKVGVYGLCWGGKLVILAGAADPKAFDAVAQGHPAKLDPTDVEKLTVPFASFISKDENKDDHQKMIDILKTRPGNEKNHFRVYPEMHHGWAGARANLANPDNLREFHDVYSRFGAFFKQAFRSA
ncbi:Alpha/Beta hydrolase protein [Powellomyces hirtus]|nr:Alpha/Beta hydrolase protein [Powellomyces hirtus]